MASDDGPVLIGSVLRAGLGLARLSVSVAGFFFRAWLAVMRVVWRQAHFAVGAALAVVAGTALALLLDWSVPFAVTLLTVTNWWLFLPTSDLVWMKRRGYVSPAYVRLALSAFASAVGVDEDVLKRETERDARLRAKLQRFRDKRDVYLNTKRREKNDASRVNERWTVDAMPTEKNGETFATKTKTEETKNGDTFASDDDDDFGEDDVAKTKKTDAGRLTASGASSDSDSDSESFSDWEVAKAKAKRRANELRVLQSARFVKTPIRVALLFVLRVNGVVPFKGETETQFLRRKNGDAFPYYFANGARVLSRGDEERNLLDEDDEDGGAFLTASRDGRRSNALNKTRRTKHIPKRALPDPSSWPHRPVFVRFSPRDNGTQRALAGWATPWGPETGEVGEKTPPSSSIANCPVNTETFMAFESELFVGKIVCRFKGIHCPANPSACKTSNDFFKKKRCTFQVLVQGKFKEEVRADLILTGGEFHKPFTERPPNYLVSAGCKFFAALTPGLELDLLCDEPYYTATLGGTVTTLSVDAEGEEPDPLSDVKERNGRMGGAFSSDQKKEGASGTPRLFAGEKEPASQTESTTAGDGKTFQNADVVASSVSERFQTSTKTSEPSEGSGVSVARRCRVLGDPRTAKEYVYNTNDVYTFDYFQSVLLFDSYCLDIGIVKLKLDRHVDGQPLGIMAKHQDGRYVYNFEIFHECLLPKTEQGVAWKREGGGTNVAP
jgi:hypothetical protein